MKKFLVFFLFFSASSHANTVYVVLSSDTSIWSNTTGVSVENSYANKFDPDVFSNPNGVYKDVMDESFRNAHTDSAGQPFKFTWFMLGGAYFSVGLNTNAITPAFLIRKYWGDEIKRWGDETALHYHHFKWDGFLWVQADTFAERAWDFDWTFSQMMIDEQIYPVSFRAGWNYMDQDYQNYLELWMPFRFEGGRWMPDFTPYHPSFTNHYAAGDMKGWEVRHYHMRGFTMTQANRIFNIAASGKQQVVCIWSHQNESDFIRQIADVDANLHAAWIGHPEVNFFYCTAREAMTFYQIHNPVNQAPEKEFTMIPSPYVKPLPPPNITPPPLLILTKPDDHSATVTIETAPDIYPLQPWVAARDYSDRYTRLDTKKIDPDKWQFAYDLNRIDTVVVGVCDIYGNVSLAEVRDGSRRISTQSEFYRCHPQNIDIETNASKALLIRRKERGSILNKSSSDAATRIESGSLVYEYDALSVVRWTGAKITGEITPGASIKTRYRFADTPDGLAKAVWTGYFEKVTLDFEGKFTGRFAQCEVVMKSWNSNSPALDSLEIFYKNIP